MKKRMINIYVEETNNGSIAVSCDVHWHESYGLYVQALIGILKSLEGCNREALCDAVELIFAESEGDDE